MKVLGMFLACAYGGFLSYCGIHIWDWQFWVLDVLFFSYAATWAFTTNK